MKRLPRRAQQWVCAPFYLRRRASNTPRHRLKRTVRPWRKPWWTRWAWTWRWEGRRQGGGGGTRSSLFLARKLKNSAQAGHAPPPPLLPRPLHQPHTPPFPPHPPIQHRTHSRGSRPGRGRPALGEADGRREALCLPHSRVFCLVRRHRPRKPGRPLHVRGHHPGGERERGVHGGGGGCGLGRGARGLKQGWQGTASAAVGAGRGGLASFCTSLPVPPAASHRPLTHSHPPTLAPGPRLLRLPDGHREHSLR